MSSRSVQIIGGPARDPVDVDRWNDALIVMDEIHANVHRGILYSVSDLVLGLANNNTESILLVLTGTIHVRFTASVSGQALLSIYEGTTVSNNGTALPSYNRNRVSANTSERATVSRAPTIIGNGTVLSEEFIPGGAKTKAGGGGSSTFGEWILSAGNYMLRITNTSGGNADLSIGIVYYEPTDTE